MHSHPSSGGGAAGRPRAGSPGRSGDDRPHCACKVVGLGAPVSVQIRLDAPELSILEDVLSAWIAAEQSPQRDPTAGDDRRAPAGDDHRAELRRMRDGLGRRRQPNDEPLKVVWPTVLAHGVLRDAVRLAAERLRETLDDVRATDAIQSAARTFLAYADTWACLRAVDDGGPPNVWL